MLRSVSFLPLLIASTATAQVQTLPIGPGQVVTVARDGRVFAHLPYGEASEDDLVEAPSGFAVGQPCRLFRDVVPDLMKLLAAADAAGQGWYLRGASCFRGVEHQRAVFCGPGPLCRDAEQRSRIAAPPGFSEHSTGYTIDFTFRPIEGCTDIDTCFASTAPYRWLRVNGPRYGFELSFPGGNGQGVSWEPWHWRWIGTSAAEPGAARARAIFAKARSRFPAFPAVATLQVKIAEAAPPVTPASAKPAGVAKKGKRRPR